MNIEFDQEPAGREPENKGGNTRVLLLVLLLLVAVFGYLYYFTGFIKPREEAKAPAPVQPAQVKQPIPPRPEAQPAGEGAKDAAKIEPAAAPKTEPAKPEAGKAEAQKEPVPKAAPSNDAAKKPEPAPAKAAKPAPAPQAVAKAAPAKPAPAPAADKAKAEAAKKAEPTAKPTANKGAKPEAAVAAKAAAGASGKKKPAPAEPVAAAAKAGDTKGAVATARKEKPKAAAVAKSTATVSKVAATGPYTLRIGEYVVPSAMDKDKDRVRNAGLTPVVREGSKKKEPMVRLLLTEAADQEGARRELARLKDATVEGFILNEGGTYRVYAGSYFVAERARREQARLASLGIKVTLRKASVSVPTLVLTTGTYETKDEALKVAAALKKAGLRPILVGAGK